MRDPRQEMGLSIERSDRGSSIDLLTGVLPLTSSDFEGLVEQRKTYWYRHLGGAMDVYKYDENIEKQRVSDIMAPCSTGRWVPVPVGFPLQASTHLGRRACQEAQPWPRQPMSTDKRNDK